MRGRSWRTLSWSTGSATVGCGAVVLAVLVANLLYLLGVFDPNPINQYSGLAVHLQGGVLTGQNNIDPNQGFVSQALGHLAAEDWLHGHVPWWNPFEGLGMPLAGEMQSAAFLPLVLLDAFSQGQILFRIALEATAGIAMLFLLRRLVKSEWAAMAGAVAFALNGTFAWMFHAPGNPVAFAPMILLGIEQAFQPRDRLRSGWPLIAAGLALSIYGGFPEVAFIDVLLALLWTAVRASELRVADLKGFIGRLSAGAVVGALLASPMLVAFGTFLQGANLLDHSGNGLASSHFPPSMALPPLVMPYIDGPIFAWLRFEGSSTAVIDFWGNVGGYVGMSLVTLAFVALAGRRERRLRIALAVWLVLAVGRNIGISPIQRIVNAIPGVSHTAFYRYSNPSMSLALIVLAAFAIDDLAGRPERRRVFLAGALALAVVLVLGVEASKYHRVVSGGSYNAVWQLASVIFAVVVVLACVVSGGLVPGPKLRAAALAAIVVVESLSFFVVPELSAPRSATIDLAPVRYLQTHLGLYRFFTLGPISPNYGSYFDIGSVNLNDEPMVASYYKYIEQSLDDNVGPAVFTGTESTNPSGPSPTKEFLEHFRSYESAGVKYVVQPQGSPRLSVDGKPLPVAFSDQLVRIVTLPDPAPLQSAIGGSCAVDSPSLDSAVVECAGPGVLIRREQFLAGWSATNNGHQVRVSSYEAVFQSVPLRPGRNVVRFSFEPPHTALVVVGFVIGLAVFVMALLPARWVARRSPGLHSKRKGQDRVPAD